MAGYCGELSWHVVRKGIPPRDPDRATKRKGEERERWMEESEGEHNKVGVSEKSRVEDATPGKVCESKTTNPNNKNSHSNASGTTAQQQPRRVLSLLASISLF